MRKKDREIIVAQTNTDIRTEESIVKLCENQAIQFGSKHHQFQFYTLDQILSKSACKSAKALFDNARVF